MTCYVFRPRASSFSLSSLRWCCATSAASASATLAGDRVNANFVLGFGWVLVFLAILSFGPFHPRTIAAGVCMIAYGAWLARRNTS